MHEYESVDKAFHVLRHVLWLQASSLAFLEYHLRTVLGNDSSAISTLRCLKLYLERLGCNHLDTDTMHSVAGSAFKLVCLHSFRQAPEMKYMHSCSSEEDADGYVYGCSYCPLS